MYTVRYIDYSLGAVATSEELGTEADAFARLNELTRPRRQAGWRTTATTYKWWIEAWIIPHTEDGLGAPTYCVAHNHRCRTDEDLALARAAIRRDLSLAE